jgi:glycine C-acetyltransferase
MSAKLFERGIFATPIVFPMVPKGTARIRVIPSAIHTKKDLDFALTIFTEIAHELHLL